MSLGIINHDPLNVNTQGIIPFICVNWKGKPLFIIEGGVRGGLLPTIYGNAYTYEDFPWPEGKKLTKERCREIAEENDRICPSLWVTSQICEQFERILGKKY